LNQRWSTRRAQINLRRGELATQFQHDHGRPPTPVEALHLAQQATLETRDAKHQPRSLAEQRSTWMNDASAVLGGRGAVAAMVATAFTPAAEPPRMADAHWVAQTADRVLAAMEETRSTWQMWHVRAEAQRHVRTVDVPAEQANTLVDLLVDEVLEHRSVALAAPPEGIEEPGALRRVDGSSVYTISGTDLYTSQRILNAEQRLLTVAGLRDGTVLDRIVVDLALLEMAANGTALDRGQASLVRQMCTSGARLQLAIAPAGAGKTTAMRALTRSWTEDGGQVIGLAPRLAPLPSSPSRPASAPTLWPNQPQTGSRTGTAGPSPTSAAAVGSPSDTAAASSSASSPRITSRPQPDSVTQPPFIPRKGSRPTCTAC
jgi:hypothetical protein